MRWDRVRWPTRVADLRLERVVVAVRARRAVATSAAMVAGVPAAKVGAAPGRLASTREEVTCSRSRSMASGSTSAVLTTVATRCTREVVGAKAAAEVARAATMTERMVIVVE